MTIDNNDAFNFLRGLADEYAELKTKYNTWNELTNLFAGANGKDRIDAYNQASDAFNKFKRIYTQYKSLCSLQPDEAKAIEVIESAENPYIIGVVYQEFMSFE